MGNLTYTEYKAHKTDWFCQAGWGIFTHYLFHDENWDKKVASFDTERLADKLASIGAKYYFITLMQRKKYMLAPNETYDRITGYKSGEACATRDLVEDLYQSLSKRGIALCLYYTGDGPLDDPQAGPRMGYVSQDDKVTKEYVEKWSSVLREYSLRYGNKIKAWWIDGCYQFIGYEEETLSMMAEAARAGNPDALVSLNCGVNDRVSSYTQHEDFTTGEMNDFSDVPDSRFVGGEQWHTLTHLGSTWGGRDCQIDGPSLADYIHRVNQKGGVVTIDIGINEEGDLMDEQLKVLRHIRFGEPGEEETGEKNADEKNENDEQRKALFFQQKELLDTFLSKHAISQAQYDKSYGDLVVKMGAEKWLKE